MTNEKYADADATADAEDRWLHPPVPGEIKLYKEYKIRCLDFEECGLTLIVYGEDARTRPIATRAALRNGWGYAFGRERAGRSGWCCPEHTDQEKENDTKGR